MNTIDITMPNGYVITAIENSKTILEEIWENKFYDRDIAITENMVVVDIGANQGFFSLYADNDGTCVNR